ncbi:MAG: 2-oxoacid:acceptor oxidoreductase subunit alpha [Candidatus Magasanikbacteria bacterium]|nr:2-oxoacid:acceptor oxidoreductase subunit alpha [Candidatus Magasanikbacteria bacterium]
MRPFVFKIGGEAGFGIMSAGLTFSKIATRSGYSVFNYSEYPSLIRGGHNLMQVTISKAVARAPYQHTDFLVALNQETIDRHQSELAPASGIVFDSDKNLDLKGLRSGINKFSLPLNQIAREVGGSLLMRNTVALGASVALLGGDLAILKQLISEEFAKKSEQIVAENHKTAEAGYKAALTKYKKFVRPVLKPLSKVKPQIVLTGNDAVALGAIAAGMQFASIYPMTPTSNILAILAAYQEEFGYIYKQPEDEISAINMAIGAAYAGARAMTATAGGGFCLMTEGYGLSGITETPLVIIEGMRPGPATGLPTWTEQGDLQFVLRAHQSDFPRIVLAPGDIQECFEMTRQAFNLAEKYQTPVVVMIDKHLCEGFTSLAPFIGKDFQIERGKLVLKKQANYERYALARDGISLRSIPGLGNNVIANSDEHDTRGYSNEEIENRNSQMEKRMQKLVTCAREDMPAPKFYGHKDAAITIVSWGSNKGAILEALPNLKDVNFLQLDWLNPFPAQAVAKILGRARQILNIECNYSGQMRGWIAEQTGIKINHSFLKYDGRPMYPEEVVREVKKVLKR